MAALVESSEDPIIGLTLDGVITDWNPAAERLYGYSREEALGASIAMLVPPERRGGSGGLLATVRAGEAVRQVDTRRMAKDGRRIDVSISMSPIRDEAGRIVGAAAFTRDISMRIAAEERLRRSQAQLAEAQELAALGSWEWDIVSGEITWSPELYRILGFDPGKSPTYEGYFEVIHPADRPRAEAATRETVATGRPLNHECRAVRPDGVERVIHARGRAVKDGSGELVRLVGTVQDVTGLAQARQRLEQANRQNEALLSSAADGIYGLDLEGRATFVNPAAAALTGYAVEETLGRRQHDLIHHTREDGSPYPLEDCPCTDVLAHGVARTVCDEVFWRRNGTSFPVEYTATPISEGGTLTGVLVVFRDITERRRIERMKDEFVAVVSHELRTPLTAMHGALGLLAGGALGPVTEPGQRMLDIAVENTHRLVRLINDILDVERMQCGHTKMELREVNAAELMVTAGRSMEALAADAGLRLLVEPLAAGIRADPDRILQVLTNLLSNAVKFTPAGGTIALTAERSAEEVVVSVEDDGRGIPADQLESIFHRFSQVDASDSRDKGGTGLGLAICRSIVDQHGGGSGRTGAAAAAAS